MASVIDVFFRALLDDGQLQVDAKRAGDKMGQTIGTSLSSKLKSAVKVTALTGLAGAAAIAGRGLAELSSITADFAAETGASADEADRAGKAINEMGGRNLQPLKEIGAALTKVHTDLGLTGTAAEKTTEAFLRYATATKQDATGAVKAFDDVLDAWGLTADDAQGIMDKLVVSHQKYGGSIEENQRALAQFAPQLKALNATIDDGIGLLNLFAASGLDASASTRALNTAVSKLKPGQSLNDLIREISAIEDPTKRAQKAIEIFGSRGGVALANALKPGITSLGDFEVSADDAAGATGRAADQIESAFPNWLALRIKGIGSAIIGLGQTIGPLGAALTGLISLGGALGFDKLFGKLGPKLAAGLSGMWKSIATSSIVTGAISFASDKAATLYLKSLIAGDVIGGALASAWGRLVALPAVGGAISAAGTAAGLAFASAAAFAIATAPVVALKVAIEWVADQANVVRLGGKGNTIEELLARKAAQDAAAAAATAAADPAATKAWQDAGIAFAERMADGFEYGAPPKMSKAITLSVNQAFGSDLAARNGYAKAFARRLAGTLADEIKSKRDSFDEAWDTFLDALKNVETPAKRLARLIGRLTSKELAKGLNDSRPEVRARAEEVLQDTIDEIGQLVQAGGKVGKDGMNALKLGMKSKNPEIRTAAQEIYNTIHTNLPSEARAKKWGKAIGDSIAAGLLVSRVAAAAAALAQYIHDHLFTNSPAKVGPLSKDGGPDGFGLALARNFARGMASGAGLVSGGAATLAGAALPQLSLAHAVPSMGFSPTGLGSIAPSAVGGDTYDIDVHLDSTPKAQDPVGVARQLARFSQAGAFRQRR